MSDQEWIYKIVHAFYEKARHDILIGYHFRHIEDFDEHIPRIAAFWEIQLLGGTNRVLTSPFDMFKVHDPLLIKRGELGRWLVLFRGVLDNDQDNKILKEKWKEKLIFFEGIFLRHFSL